MQLEALKWLEDMRLAPEQIRPFAAGRTARDYASDELLRLAIERQFAIIGEALGQLRRADPSTVERVTNYQQIVDFRNRLVHRYWDIQPEAVWQHIEQDMVVLIREVRTLLLEGDPDFGNPPAGRPQSLPPVPPQELS